ncbi:MAG: hypothetical protein ABEH56_08835 [Salinirussus sp.]
MGPAITVAIGLAAINAVMLVVLGVVWGRNYRQFRSNLTLGLLAFAAVLLVENVVAIYFFFSMASLYASSPFVGEVVAGLRGLQFLALVFLTYVTMQ